jgi:NarL family two-component system response regulator LiaR
MVKASNSWAEQQGIDNRAGGGNLDKIKILIADDHTVVRAGTRGILEQQADLEVVAEAGDGEEAVRLCSRFKPDVALIDIAMPKLDGIETTKGIKDICPSVVVLVLSAYDDDQFVFSVLEAGAAGYLLKSVRSHELVEAVRAVYAGESVLHPSIARKVVNRFARPAVVEAEPLETLSERELEVLKLASKGLSNKDIAEELYISIRTVQGHLGNIFDKLQVSSRTEAVVHALKGGWITLDDVE